MKFNGMQKVSYVLNQDYVGSSFLPWVYKWLACHAP